MNTELEEINNLYLQAEPTMYLSREMVDRLSPRELEILSQKHVISSRLVSQGYKKFRLIADGLESQEVIEAYKEGSRMLRANLGGLIMHRSDTQRFDTAYISLMSEAIIHDHDAAYIFLFLLDDILNIEDIKPLALQALNSPIHSTRNNALAIIMSRKITDALPLLKSILEKQTSEDTKQFVVDVIGALENN